MWSNCAGEIETESKLVQSSMDTNSSSNWFQTRANQYMLIVLFSLNLYELFDTYDY